MILKYLSCLLLTLIFSICGFAQHTVTGRVMADSTKPLPGVTVTIENTVVTTITDSKGNYAISAGEDAVLVFSLAGYRTQEIQVHGRSIIDVNMEKAAVRLMPQLVNGQWSMVKAAVISTCNLEGER